MMSMIGYTAKGKENESYATCTDMDVITWTDISFILIMTAILHYTAILHFIFPQVNKSVMMVCLLC